MCRPARGQHRTNLVRAFPGSPLVRAFPGSPKYPGRCCRRSPAGLRDRRRRPVVASFPPSCRNCRELLPPRVLPGSCRARRDIQGVVPRRLPGGPSSRRWLLDSREEAPQNCWLPVAAPPLLRDILAGHLDARACLAFLASPASLACRGIRGAPPLKRCLRFGCGRRRLPEARCQSPWPASRRLRIPLRASGPPHRPLPRPSRYRLDPPLEPLALPPLPHPASLLPPSSPRACRPSVRRGVALAWGPGGERHPRSSRRRRLPLPSHRIRGQGRRFPRSRKLRRRPRVRTDTATQSRVSWRLILSRSARQPAQMVSDGGNAEWSPGDPGHLQIFRSIMPILVTAWKRPP